LAPPNARVERPRIVRGCEPSAHDGVPRSRRAHDQA